MTRLGHGPGRRTARRRAGVSRAGGRPPRTPAPGRVARPLAPLLWLPTLACADTVRPVLGGLSVGLQPTSFEVPVMQNEEPPFEYPRAAWKDRVGGETLLRIHISPGGAVDSVLVEVSSGHRGLDSAAVVGARRLRYRPARRGGEPMAVWATLPVRYPMPAGMSGGP